LSQPRLQSALFPKWSLGYITALLTVVTLFFGELLPKAVAVANSELVARKLVPSISKIASTLSPITFLITYMSNAVLSIFGLRLEEDKNVSEDMVRMVVAEAQRTEGIERNEGRMIEAVLDMDTREVEKIMQPRVDIVALPFGNR
jgi:putative hemolysin